MGQRKISLRALRQRVDEYLAGEGVKSPAGLAVAVGVDSGRLREMCEGGGAAADLLRLAMTRLEQAIVENGLRGKSNATMTTFLLKTQFGYREKGGAAKEGDAMVELPEELKKYAV